MTQELSSAGFADFASKAVTDENLFANFTSTSDPQSSVTADNWEHDAQHNYGTFTERVIEAGEFCAF